MIILINHTSLLKCILQGVEAPFRYVGDEEVSLDVGKSDDEVLDVPVEVRLHVFGIFLGIDVRADEKDVREFGIFLDTSQGYRGEWIGRRRRGTGGDKIGNLADFLEPGFDCGLGEFGFDVEDDEHQRTLRDEHRRHLESLQKEIYFLKKIDNRARIKIICIKKHCNRNKNGKKKF